MDLEWRYGTNIMKDGYWGNYITGNIFLIDEHEMWIRRENNADKLGIHQTVQRQFKKFAVGTDRDRLLPFIFANAPVIRFRGHGSYVTMEFNCTDWAKPLELVRKWCEVNAGPLLGLLIVNFAANEVIETTWEIFEREPPCPVKLKTN